LGGFIRERRRSSSVQVQHRTKNKMILFVATLTLHLFTVAESHGALYIPTPRNAGDRSLPEFRGGKSPIEACTCNNGNGGFNAPTEGCDLGLRGSSDGLGDGQSCLWWSQGCSIGCDACATETYGMNPITGNPPQEGKAGFRKRYCNSTFEATLPREAWTLNIDAIENSEEDSYRFNPWRAPGFAPVVDACGQAGGEYAFQKMGGDSVFFNTSFAGKGEKGSRLPPIPREARTEWKRGSFVEVAWGVRYNHGGGYQYRLCPADQDLTEECFQKMPLEFDRMRQALRWNDGKTTYALKEQAIFVDGVNVTYPPGSTWARNPIPRIFDSKLGLSNEDSCPGPTTRAAGSPPGCLAFDAPCPWDQYKTRGLLPCNQSEGTRLRHNAHGRSLRCDGDGMSECSSDWVVGVISDHVYIPSDIPAGDYVLGWRWDAEETAQVWSNCADVIITL